MDEAGYIYYRGRIKDIVKISGFTVSPAEVEDFLKRHDAIAAVQVIRFRSSNQDALGAAIVRKPSFDLEVQDVTRFCTGRIASYKIPSKIILLDALPTKSSANSDKTDLGALRRLLEE